MSTNVSVSVVMIAIRGSSTPAECYQFDVEVCAGTQHRVFLVSKAISGKLWCQFVHAHGNTDTSIRGTLTNMESYKLGCDEFRIPGRTCQSFLDMLGAAISRKLNMNVITTTWIAPSSLYQLFFLSCSVSTELFADCFNESGILSSYCSADVEDKNFGPIGSWEKNEEFVEGGGGNPPFIKPFIEELMEKFDDGVRGFKPYRRLVFLPLGRTYNVAARLRMFTSEATLLVTAPPGSFSFQNEGVLLSRSHLTSKPNMFQSIGIAVWCNRAYLLERPPPLDIQEMFEAWVGHCLYYPEKIQIHPNGFEKAFPLELRNRESLLESLLNSIV